MASIQKQRATIIPQTGNKHDVVSLFLFYSVPRKASLAILRRKSLMKHEERVINPILGDSWGRLVSVGREQNSTHSGCPDYSPACCSSSLPLLLRLMPLSWMLFPFLEPEVLCS